MSHSTPLQPLVSGFLYPPIQTTQTDCLIFEFRELHYNLRTEIRIRSSINTQLGPQQY